MSLLVAALSITEHRAFQNAVVEGGPKKKKGDAFL